MICDRCEAPAVAVGHSAYEQSYSWGPRVGFYEEPVARACALHLVELLFEDSGVAGETRTWVVREAPPST